MTKTTAMIGTMTSTRSRHSDRRRCTCCQRRLPVAEFYRDPRRKGKYRAQCKRCTAIKAAGRRRQARYTDMLAARERERIRKQQWRDAHREQCNAYGRELYWKQKRQRFEQIMRGVV